VEESVAAVPEPESDAAGKSTGKEEL
jgi:hypothetical protein